jgi:phospholipase C
MVRRCFIAATSCRHHSTRRLGSVAGDHGCGSETNRHHIIVLTKENPSFDHYFGTAERARRIGGFRRSGG